MKKITSYLIIIFFLSCSYNKNRLFILFNQVDNLETDSAVFMRGVAVGEVINMKLLDDVVPGEIKLNEKTKIPAGSEFQNNSVFLPDHHLYPSSLLGIKTL